MEFTITALDGDSVKVESENWMTAMGRALPFFDIDIHDVERMTCSAAKDGSILVEDGRRSWMVRQHGTDIQVRVTPKSEKETWTPRPTMISVAPESDLREGRPQVTMPESSLKRDEPRTLAEHLFELSTGSDQLTSAQTCDMALDAILGFVRADGSCVLLGTLNDPSLVCVSTRGPRAGRFLNRKVGFGEGLPGMAFDMRESLLVQEVTSVTPHVDLADGASLSVLCVPLLDDEGGASGVIQLVNPADRPFAESNVGIVEMVARTLSTALAGR